VLEQVAAGVDPAPMDFGILEDWRQDVQWRKGDAVLLCEANVEASEVVKYAAGRPEGPNDRAHMLFSFLLNPQLWLALARRDAEPVIDGLRHLPALPAMAQWATFLRNHDELDLSRLTKEQQRDVFRAFAPRADMRLFDRGVRRRLAPMLRGDRRHIELAYSLQFTSPGTPVLRYGEEIGMGEDLALPGRAAIRTPMQWEPRAGGGFSTARPEALAAPVPTRGRYGVRQVNVHDQERDPGSLLSWFERMIRTLRECPEVGVGQPSVLDVPLPRPVLAHRFDAPEGAMVFLHNLDDRAVTVDLGRLDGMDGPPADVFTDGDYPPLPRTLTGVELHGFGYRWIRLRRRASS
jgi:maltose alpha-D-glucosyltransferase / alpha-amylase